MQTFRIFMSRDFDPEVETVKIDGTTFTLDEAQSRKLLHFIFKRKVLVGYQYTERRLLDHERN
jgi:hypothetical protein